MRNYFVTAILLSCLVLPVSCGKNLGPDKNANRMSSIKTPDPVEKKSSLEFSQDETKCISNWNYRSLQMMPVLGGNGFAKDMAFSPLSLHTVLSMTAMGVSGETREELVSFLGNSGISDAALSALCRKYLVGLPALDFDNSICRQSNAVVVNDIFNLAQPFRQRIESDFYAPCVSFDFNDVQAVTNTVNDWVYDSTEGLIPRIIDDSNVNSNSALFLLGTLYCKIPLSLPFEPEGTKSEPFYLQNGTTTSVDMMHVKRPCVINEYEKYQLISFIVDKSGAYKFTVLLPRVNVSLAEAVDAAISNNGIENKGEWANTKLALPKFNIENGMMLNSALCSMGVNKMFTNSSDFDRMLDSGEGLVVTEVFQSNYFSLCETGISAASASKVEIDLIDIGTNREPPVITADRPFAFFLTESTTDLILFEGVFSASK